MLKQKEQILKITLVSVTKNTLAVLVICSVLFLAPTVKSKTQEQQAEAQDQLIKTQEQKSEMHEQSSQPEHNDENSPSTTSAENKEEPIKKSPESTKKDEELKIEPKPSLKDVIKAARTWGPVYTSWYGKKAPDFTLKDINGKERKLSDYKGKDVMIIFWATWCGPCIMEVPHLIALRNIISTDELAMLAISNEKPKLVKRFVEDRKINYTVLTTGTSDLPEPYKGVRNIPCSFFIDSKGKIKLATEGLISLGEFKAILQAE